MTNSTQTAWTQRDELAARRYLEAHVVQRGVAYTAGCQITQRYRLLPVAAFAGIPSGMHWVKAGELAALRVLCCAGDVRDRGSRHVGAWHTYAAHTIRVDVEA